MVGEVGLELRSDKSQAKAVALAGLPSSIKLSLLLDFDLRTCMVRDNDDPEKVSRSEEDCRLCCMCPSNSPYSMIPQKLRQTFSKYNLFNLSRNRDPRYEVKSFFQQKWLAKAQTRSYHGETVREKQWTRMFRRGISAVVPMDHKYLAEYDGSQQAEGRGSGADTPPMRRKPSLKIPFMNMVSNFVSEEVDPRLLTLARYMRQPSGGLIHQFIELCSLAARGKQGSLLCMVMSKLMGRK